MTLGSTIQSNQDVLGELADGAYIVDHDRNITYWNPSAEAITGYTRQRVMGQSCRDNLLMHINDTGELLCLRMCPVAHTLRDGQVREARVYLHHADGHRVPVIVRVAPIKEGEVITGALEIFTVDQSLATVLEQQEEITCEDDYDALTHLCSSAVAHRQVENRLAQHDEDAKPFGVLMVDIDYLSRVNNAFGYQTGDQIIQMVARSLSSSLTPQDFAARWGGEEFLAIVDAADEPSLFQIAERIRILVEHSSLTLNAPQLAVGSAPVMQTIRVTVSVGGALVEPGDTPARLLARAERTLQLSKSQGRNRVTI